MIRTRFRLSKRGLIFSTLVVSACLLIVFGDTRGSAVDVSPYLPSDTPSLEQPHVIPAGWVGGARRKAQVPLITETLEYASDGLVYGFDQVHAALKKGGGRTDDTHHPITELMARGRRRWDGLIKRQSKTLGNAVKEYRKRYNRNPPRGFDQWFLFCKERNVKIIDDYDQIERDIGPWLGIAPSEFRRRVEKLEQLGHSYKIVLRPNNASTISGDCADLPRPLMQFSHLEPIAPYLSEDITIYASEHDMGSTVVPEQFRSAALDAAARGTYLTEEQLEILEKPGDGGMGLLASCDERSPARTMNETGPLKAADAYISQLDAASNFIYDPTHRLSYCQNPELMRYHGAFTYPQRRPSEMRPVFQMSKLAQNNEFLLTPLEAFRNATSAAGIENYSEWEEKTIDKLFWRGSTTGDFYTPDKTSRPGYNWRKSHRPRLHLFAQRKDGDSTVWVNRDRGWHPERWANAELNERYLDVGFAAKQCDEDNKNCTGRVHQCDPKICAEMLDEIEFRPRVEPDQAKRYKYVFDIDGNGWSSRFHRLLASGSVVLKSTIYSEWFSEWLTPWVHYVPVKLDYSDVYDIMSFFAGPPDDEGGSGDSTRTAHDDLARQIAANARQFTLEHWRWEDMQAYMFRMLLEYARLGAEDRDAHSFTL